MFTKNKIKILFLIQGLYSRGAQRQFVELLTYMKNKPEYDLRVVTTKKEIRYKKFLELNIPYLVIERRWIKKDPRLFFLYYRLCREYKPDIINAWGGMVAFYSLPSAILLKIPLVNYQIQTAPLKYNRFSFVAMVNYLNFAFSKIVLANSYAGLKAFHVNNRKSDIIYNGVNMSRFNNLPDKNLIKKKYNIKTDYTVVMVASFSSDKKYDLFVEVANLVTKFRRDITFIGVGNINSSDNEYLRVKKLASHNSRILFPGEIDDVESLVNVSDIGVLFTYSEGISNSIIEYMALGKPVIANRGGGTCEIVKHGSNGYLIQKDEPEQISALILDLINNKEKGENMGEAGKRIIHDSFTLEKMGGEFDKIFKRVYDKNF